MLMRFLHTIKTTLDPCMDEVIIQQLNYGKFH